MNKKFGNNLLILFSKLNQLLMLLINQPDGFVYKLTHIYAFFWNIQQDKATENIN